MHAHHAFVKKTAAALRGSCAVAEGARIVAAVSGGADSVALLCALATLAPRRKWGYDLHVAHVQHHLRDPESEDDAKFTEHLASRLGLAFHRRDVDLSAANTAGNLEAAARKARYDALLDIARSAEAHFVATAQHSDDQLETLLMRILRGSSVRGLACMRWRRLLCPDDDIRLMRPLLDHDRADVLAFLNDLDQPWREDHSNADLTRTRARLRHQVLPVLRDLNPHAARHAQAVTDQMHELQQILNSCAMSAEAVVRIEAPFPGNTRLAREDARDMTPTIMSELTRRLLYRAGARTDTITRRTIATITHAAVDDQIRTRKFDVGNNVQVKVTGKTVFFTNTQLTAQP